MAPREDTAPEIESETEEKLANIVAKLTFYIVPKENSVHRPSKKKAAAPKKEVRLKNFEFEFKPTEANYVAFLQEILAKHHVNGLEPVNRKTVYPMKVQVPPAK